MINSVEIQNSVTRRLSNKFPNIDIFTGYTNQVWDNACFIVNIIPKSSQAITLNHQREHITIEIKYYGNKDSTRADMLIIRDALMPIFARTLTVNSNEITLGSHNNVILKDEVGYGLTYLIELSYVIDLDITGERDSHYDLMQEIHTTTI